MTEWLASFDIGKKNFCIYIEEIDTNTIKKIKNIDIKNRYNIDGSPTKEMYDILEKVYMNGKIIFHKNYDLTNNTEKKKYLDREIYHNMIYVLDDLLKYFDKCTYFVVEEQMFFKGKNNKMAVKLGQHCQSYFYFKYGHFKTIIEFPAYHKTHILGCKKLDNGITKKGKTKYKNVDKPARKKWAIEKAKEVVLLRNEKSDILEKKRGTKLDDLSDTLIQLQAFKYMFYVDKKDF